MNRTNPLRRSEQIILAVILVAAAFLRAEYLLQIEHNIDHAYPVWQALNTLEHGALPLTGQSTSVLFDNPALTGYLYLPLLALARSPITPYILVIALNTLAVLLSFRAVRGLLGTTPGLIAAALIAVNPWIIEYSRTSWVQSLLPFFACAVAWLLWPVLSGRSRNPRRRTLLALVMLTLMAQTYLLAYLMVVPVGLLIMIFWRRVPKHALLAGSAIFLAAAAVYGAGLLANRQAVQRRLDDFGASPARLSGEAWSHAVRLVTGNDYAAARGVGAPAGDAELRQGLSQIAHTVLLAALILGSGLALVNIRRAKAALRPGRPTEPPLQKGDAGLILLIWFLPPVALMSYVGQPVHPFYQLLGLPAGYGLAAWGIAAVFRPQTRIGGAALVALFVPFALLMGLNSARYYQETAARPGAHGTTALSLEYGLKLGDAINAHLPPGGIVYADESAWILNSFAGRTFLVSRFARAPRVTIIPWSGGLYLNAPGEDHDVTIPLPDGYPLTLDQFEPGAASQVVPLHALDYASEQGIRLIGYDLDGDALTTYWRVDSMTPETRDWLFAPFAHVFDDSGQRVQIVDGEVVPGGEWRVGDVHVHHMTIPDAVQYEIRVGQYDALRQQNVIFLPDYTPLIILP